MGSRYFSRRCVGAAQPLLHILSRSPTTSRKVAPRSIQRHIFIHCITILSKQATCGPPAARCHLSAHGLCLLFLHSHLIVCMSSGDSYSGSELDLCSTMRSACKCELVFFFFFFPMPCRWAGCHLWSSLRFQWFVVGVFFFLLEVENISIYKNNSSEASRMSGSSFYFQPWPWFVDKTE